MMNSIQAVNINKNQDCYFHNNDNHRTLDHSKDCFVLGVSILEVFSEYEEKEDRL